MEVSGAIADAILAFGDEEWVWPIESIQKAANGIVDGITGNRADGQCLIVATRPELRLFRLHANNSNPLKREVRCDEVEDKAVAGDTENPAIFWPERYYERLPIERLTLLAAHLILSAGQINPATIRGLEVVLCSNGGFRRLTKPQIEELKLRVREWDEATLASIAGGGDATVDKTKFDALLKRMLATPPLPKSEVKVEKPKPKKKRKPDA
jgi:hypothetical protein